MVTLVADINVVWFTFTWSCSPLMKERIHTPRPFTFSIACQQYQKNVQDYVTMWGWGELCGGELCGPMGQSIAGAPLPDEVTDMPCWMSLDEWKLWCV